MHVKSTVKIIISSVLAVVSFLFIAYIVYVAEPSGINAKPDLVAFVYNGIPLTVIGTTSPGALVTVRIPKLILSKPVMADEEGHFMVTLNNVERGVYEMIISAIKDGSSNETSRLIGIPDSPAVTQVTISEISLPLTPVKQIKKERADLNKDGRVNLVDLSILLHWWSSPIIYRPHNPEADLNGDGKVDLRDVALLLANWTN